MEIKKGKTMKKINKIIPALLLIILGTSSLFAQSFDADRMNRDITILENVLSELFKVDRLSSSNNRVYVSGTSSNVKGAYLPDYGVIFMIPRVSSVRVVSSNQEASQAPATFYYGDNDKSEVTEDNIIHRSKEFIRDYAPTIGQLKPNEKVMIVYGATSNRSNTFFVSFNQVNKNNSKAEEMPIISIVVDKKQLDDFRSGKLSEENFNDKISVAKNTKKELLDLKVLGNIFETALSEDDDYQFHLVSSNSLSYLYLENFGAIYTLSVHKGHGRNLTQAISVNSQSGANIAEYRQKVEEQEKELNQIMKGEYDNLVTRMKEFIIDYGRTLSSVKQNQHLLVTVNISGRFEDIPDRVDFQVKRSVLDQVDRGSMNRQQALSQVLVTEY